jgi:hypothetical protein
LAIKTAILFCGVVGASLLLAFSPFLTHNAAYAAKLVAWDGGGDGIHWSDPKNWKGNSLPTSSDNIKIDGSKRNVMVHLDIDFTSDASRTLTIDSGDALVIDQGKSLNNFGTINNNAVFFFCESDRNCGGINNLGTINNEGTINNNGGIAPGDFTNSGTINNSGVLYVPARGNPGEFNSVQNVVNSGTINSYTFSQISINIDNRASGIINNEGTIINECGNTFINSGEINGNQPVDVPC